MTRSPDHPIITAQQHFLQQQKEHYPDASGEFSWLLSGITLATKMIQAKVRRAGLVDIFGGEGAVNVHGEEQQKLDDDATQDVLQPGTRQVAAGYVVYGSSTILVYTTGQGVHGFTLEPSVGAYLLSHENIRMPEQGQYYSVNEAYRDGFPAAYREYLDQLRHKRYASRYIGSLVADFHRTLLKGGVFLYPPTTDYPGGKLRLLYEANPIAFIAEQAGGIASTGTGRVLEVHPTSIHERTPLIVGSPSEMRHFARCLEGATRD
ncbi:MAG: fructose-1,6-bisphosphatase [Planctomycetaceae bacterium]|nr:fructose-1,6-bisphosphatase [Planctomycetaceae bacterium]